MRIIVIYKSKSGFVEKYAKWIAQELSADIFEASKVNLEVLKKYNTIIYGGGLYAVGINGINIIKKNINILKDKNIIVFASGASPFRNEIIKEIKNKNFTIEQQKYIKFYYMRGGFDYNKLTLVDKFLMKLLKLKLNRKKELTPDERGMLAAYNNPVDFTKKKNTDEIINYVKTLK